MVFVGWFLSTAITFSKVDMLTYYEKMGLPEQQLDMFEQYSAMWGSMSLFMGIWLIVILGYLLYIKKYFPGHSQQEPISS
jgi:uncharacterized membrane protein